MSTLLVPAETNSLLVQNIGVSHIDATSFTNTASVSFSGYGEVGSTERNVQGLDAQIFIYEE